MKLAKYIQYSYPQYKKWLDRNESTYGSAVCQMDPCQFLPLDQLRPNRWKFICKYCIQKFLAILKICVSY